MYYVFMLFYTFLHFKRRLFETASFNVKRQLLLFSVAKTDKLPLLYSIILRSRIMIYKSAFERLKGVKRPFRGVNERRQLFPDCEAVIMPLRI